LSDLLVEFPASPIFAGGKLLFRHMTKKFAIIVNMDAGTGEINNSRIRRGLQRALERRGFQGDQISWVTNRTLTNQLVRIRSGNASLVIVGGGDGTLNSAANILADGDITIGVLPLGTRNHFARDIGMPLEPEAAIGALAEGKVQKVDAGEVNGRRFLNNASIGMYPQAVKECENYRGQTGPSRLATTARAMWRVFMRPPALEMKISANDREQTIRTPFVFVGNNEYGDAPLSMMSRNSLQDGHLSVFYAHRASRFSLLRIAVLALLGRLREMPELGRMELTSLVIENRRPRIQIALDGEIREERSPLEFRIRARCQKILSPSNKIE
jgi:diacylglycerol kinase family enzyme